MLEGTGVEASSQADPGLVTEQRVQAGAELPLLQGFSSCGAHSLGQMFCDQLFTLQLITVANLQLWNSNEQFCGWGHHT